LRLDVCVERVAEDELQLAVEEGLLAGVKGDYYAVDSASAGPGGFEVCFLCL
jgi:hypothetical protein